MKDVVFTSVAFIENGDFSKGRFFFNTTLPAAIQKMKDGKKYAFNGSKFEWVDVPPVDPIKNIKINILTIPQF